MKTYKIHLIRHGQTAANETGTYIGRTDLPLSPAGVNELLQMKKVYTYPYGMRFFTSPLTRCKQTLHVLYPDSKPEVVEASWVKSPPLWLWRLVKVPPASCCCL